MGRISGNLFSLTSATFAVWCLLTAGVAGADETTFTAEDRAYWAFRPLRKPSVPAVRDTSALRNPIDAFIRAKLGASGLEPAPPAARRAWIRRAYFDLLGLPPSPEEVDRFLADTSPDAFEKLVERLLSSPAYGERWGRHWLDLVRYADSDGFRADDHRPRAWRYRDYVIRSFNDDKPYHRFVIEQLAGDEVTPDDPQAMIATGYLRHWPYEHNQRDVHRQWSDILDDITDITGEVFLGLGFRCARCHNHKFDPILQKDYYRLRSFFAAIIPYQDLVAASRKEKREHEQNLKVWLDATREIRAAIEEIEGPLRKKLQQPAIDKFIPLYQELLAKSFDTLSPADKQIHHLAYRHLVREAKNLTKAIKGDARKTWDGLQKKLAEFDHLKPAPLTPALSVVDVGTEAPPTVIPGDKKKEPVEPGFLTILEARPAAIEPVPESPQSTGRRSTLARWIIRGDNRLTTRVLVNRIWQHHFGQGLVATANDFGRQGEPPSHPELLDWLACEFTERGWSIKEMHRLIMSSSTYRQSSLPRFDAARRAAQVDPGNRLLWRMPVRRLEAEVLRDAMLVASGELAGELGGPGVSENDLRRSVYMRVMRNNRADFMDAFDSPDNFNSCARRVVTTTAPQALLLLNGEWTLKRAAALARRAERESAPTLGDAIRRAFQLTLGREPQRGELAAAKRFLDTQTSLVAETLVAKGAEENGGTADGEEFLREARAAAMVDLCHVLLNANEFLYVD